MFSVQVALQNNAKFLALSLFTWQRLIDCNGKVVVRSISFNQWYYEITVVAISYLYLAYYI